MRTPLPALTQVAVWLFLTAMVMPLAANANQRGSLPDFTRLVEENADAVVNISTTSRQAARSGRGREELEQLPEFFREFFGGPRGAPERDRQRERQSMGSGFIVSADGYVLTNNHVIENADEIIVKLKDRRELEATVVGTDPRTDMAVLKIHTDNNDLPVARIGKSADLQVGEWVFAIGSPFGFDHTVTAGIVSAKGRALPRESYVPFIQTDVAINPGNSGGPLFNMDGEVVGVNSQIYTRSGGFMGVSFSIPMDMAMDVFEQIRSDGRVSRGWLGVLIQEVNRDMAENLGLAQPSGALVADVVPDSPAAKAGLQPGDVILSYNGQNISMSSDLPPMVGRTEVDTDATVTIMRDGSEQTLNVRIEQLPEDDEVAARESEPRETSPSSRLGMEVTTLPERLRSDWNLEGGVLVSNVTGGPAQRQGIRRNDVIVEMDRKPVHSPEAFEEAVAAMAPGESVLTRIFRQGQARMILLRMPEE
ncbi:MAG: DegQ family serine endoprotease [Halomonadaceae bacterium]|nr:MAG: DegQ family serine endoprotease [Halomonadaceae bacterium]